jgi:hypothetical protein
MVAQEFDQLMSTVLEGPIKAMVAMKFLGFFRQHPIFGQVVPDHPLLCHMGNSRLAMGNRQSGGPEVAEIAGRQYLRISELQQTH